ncbi:MAG: glycosyltransferase family 39 protein [Chthoniobacter sp.]|uniref:ArnT family glycosyltransferase n=1 Tax=Chthoniobacter sp. TaxID=2510640 RepID=UPI0032A58742
MFKSARPWVVSLIVLVLAFDLAFFWQWSFGAYKSEFGGHPDEAAHVVTGLFIRDALVEAGHYAAGGFHGSPIRIGKEFAERYYTHYPKIGLGVWPPFFYVVQSAWTLPLGASRTSLLFLLCSLAAILAWLEFRVLREEFGIWLAAACAAVLISLPLVRSYYGMVMAETLSAVLMFAAIVAFGDFLDREKRSDAIWFGVLAALAILTKGTGLALALAAPLALVFARRLSLLKRPALWLAVFIVLVVAGPWTWKTRDLGKGGWLQPNPSWSFTLEALPYYAGKFGLGLGAVLLLLFGVGVVVKIRRGSPQQGRWTAAGALILSVLIFQSIAPVGLEARHLIPALPAALMFAAAGFNFIAGKLADGRRVAGLSVLVLAGMFLTILPITTKGSSGFAPLAQQMLAEASPDEVALVSSDATGEGMFIAEVALHESRPGHVIQRASKSLASSTWSGSGYVPAFDKEEDILHFLASGKIRYLILDDAVPDDKRREHHDQLKRLVATYPDRFSMIGESDVWRRGTRQPITAKLYLISPKN